MDLEIKKLYPELVDDFLYFFDKLAFTNNPEWSFCYCYFFHCDCPADEWVRRTGEDNREASKQLILSNRMNGFMAYVDNKPVGWCHSDDKNNLARLKHHFNEAVKYKDNENTEKVGTIVCFIIAPEYRKKGIARELLKCCRDEFKKQGYSYIEAYPKKECTTDSGNYHGPLNMYISNGFEIYREFSDYLIVRKMISK